MDLIVETFKAWMRLTAGIGLVLLLWVATGGSRSEILALVGGLLMALGLFLGWIDLSKS